MIFESLVIGATRQRCHEELKTDRLTDCPTNQPSDLITKQLTKTQATDLPKDKQLSLNHRIVDKIVSVIKHTLS